MFTKSSQINKDSYRMRMRNFPRREKPWMDQKMDEQFFETTNYCTILMVVLIRAWKKARDFDIPSSFKILSKRCSGYSIEAKNNGFKKNKMRQLEFARLFSCSEYHSSQNLLDCFSNFNIQKCEIKLFFLIFQQFQTLFTVMRRCER